MIGTLIAERYRLNAPIGAGGMGSVFRATDERLDRPVAVKLLLPELATDLESIARFEREARATAKLTHPGIVQILDFGSTPAPNGKGRASFLVMELADGDTLARVMTHAPLSVPDAIAIGMQMLSALSMAHAAGIVHRDLKPENVMISRGGDGHVHAKILDFGLAQIKTGSVYSRLTQTGALVGTPRYMAPEQARGEECDARTDVYAVGLVLYAALTGRAPYDAESIAGIVTQVLEMTPPRLDTVRPAVPGVLAHVLATAMHKSPASRFATAQDFAGALDQVRSQPAPVTTPEAYAATGAMHSVDFPIPDVLLPAHMPAPAATPQFTPAPTSEPEPEPELPQSRSGVIVLGVGLFVIAAAAIGGFVWRDPMHLDLLHPLHVAPPTQLPPTSVAPAPSTVVPAASTVTGPVPATTAPPPTHVSHDHGAHPPPSMGDAPPPTETALIPECRVAVHCCELTGGGHDVCRTQAIGGHGAPPGGNPDVCPIAIRSYHDVLVSQHHDASACEWPPSGAHDLAAPAPSVARECVMATHCCVRTGGADEACHRYGAMPDPSACLTAVQTYHTVLIARGEDASDCVFH